jgi:taurine dioxygenase
MSIDVVASGQACGAMVHGVDLQGSLTEKEILAIRTAWLEYHVLAFPEQDLSDDDLERFTLRFGPFGHDPFIKPIDGRSHVIAVHRAAAETASVFAENWHSDWSFQKHPPAGTCLYAKIIPPVGGDTIFSNQHLALEKMHSDLRGRIEGKVAVHSAKRAYGPAGAYGDADKHSVRAMRIVSSVDAEESELHPLITPHPETGELGLFSCAPYICGLEGMSDEEAWPLLMELLHWQGREEFQYRHIWEEHMLVMWDNRSVLHMATGGYDGHERLLHRTTIGALSA